MRICYLCADLGIPPDGKKGASAHVRGFLRALRLLGHEVLLVTPHELEGLELGPDVRIPALRATPPAIIADIGSSVEPRLRRALGHLWTNVAIERALGGLVHDWRPDLIYERYSPFALAGVLTAERAGVPHILEVNAPLAWEGVRYRKQALPEASAALERAVLVRAARIVTVSAELAEILASTFGIPEAKIDVVPNGVDAELFEVQGETLREGLEGRIVIGFVGGLRPWHGVELLAAAFRELATDPRLHLLVVGDGPEAQRIEALKRELPSRVTWVGAVPHRQVPAWVRAIDIAVAPYPALEKFYYSPLKVLEYMAAGRAVVASEVGQLRDLIRPGWTGLLVAPGEPAALVRAIRSLADDASKRDALGTAAAVEIRRSHLWTHRVSRILDWRRVA